MDSKVEYINKEHIVYFSYSWNGKVSEDDAVYITGYLDTQNVNYDRDVLLSELNMVYGTLEKHISPLQTQLKRFGIRFKFDKGEGVERLCGWGDDIHSAENEIGEGDAVMVWVSRKYLMSPHTMKEWHSIVKKGNLKDRAYPVCIDHPLRLKFDGNNTVELKRDFYYDYIPQLWEKSLQKLKPEYIQSQFDNNYDKFREETIKDYDAFFDVLGKNTGGSIDNVAKETYTQITSKFVRDFWPNENSRKIFARNFSQNKELVPRDNCVNKLYKLLQKKDFVCLKSMGGYGKSSLVNLLAFQKDENGVYLFNRVYRAIVKNNIKDDVVEQLSPLVKGLADFSAEDNSYEKYKKVRKGLETLSKDDYDQSKNLLVIDINQCDEIQFRSFVDDLISCEGDDNRLRPDGWKVLIVSRVEYGKQACPDYIIDFDANKDFKYLKDLFEKVSGYKKAGNERLRLLFDKLCYSPLLIKILAGKIYQKPRRAEKTIEDVLQKKITYVDQVEDDSLKSNMSDADYKTYNTVGEYLKDFIKFDTLPYNSRYLLGFFMLWPYEPMTVDTIVKLLDGCYLLKNNDSTKNYLWCFDICIGEDCEKSAKALKSVLDKLSGIHLLDKAKDEDTYSMHPLVSEVLRDVYLLKIKQNAEKHWYLRDYTKKHWYLRYRTNCIIHRNDKDYFRFINYGIDKGVFDDDFVKDLKNNKNYMNYVLEKKLVGEIEALKRSSKYDQLSEKYLELAKLHEGSMNTDSSFDIANSITYFLKIKDASDVQRLKLAFLYCRAGYSDIAKSTEYYENAVAIYKSVSNLEAVDRIYCAAARCAVKFAVDCGNYVKPSEDFLKVFEETYKAFDDNEAVFNVEKEKFSEIDVKRLDNDFLKCTKANVCCRIADAKFESDPEDAERLYKMSADTFAQVDMRYLTSYSKKNMANANYRYAFLSERGFDVPPEIDNIMYLDEFSEERESFKKDVALEWETKKKETKPYSDKADDIWKTLEAETDGDLKGFVITSYGIYDKQLDYKLVKVEPGEFLMGVSEDEYKAICDEAKNDKDIAEYYKKAMPQHKVRITHTFYIGMYPITKGQWYDGRFGDDFSIKLDIAKYDTMKSEGIALNILYQKAKGLVSLNSLRIGGENADNAMNYVSYNDTEKYIKGINSLLAERNQAMTYSLPTECEWEFAARGGIKNNIRYEYSGCNLVYDVSFCGKGLQYTKPLSGDIKDVTEMTGVGPSVVGSLKPNELGIYDMSGNVWEWCRDWCDDGFYQKCKDNSDLCVDSYNSDKPVDDDILARVLRGGSWDFDARLCRVSYRDGNSPRFRNGSYGFRLSLSLQTENNK